MICDRKTSVGTPIFYFIFLIAIFWILFRPKLGDFYLVSFVLEQHLAKKCLEKGVLGVITPLIYPRGVNMWVEKLSLINFDIYTLNIQSFTKIYTVYIFYPSSVMYTPLGVGIDLNMFNNRSNWRGIGRIWKRGFVLDEHLAKTCLEKGVLWVITPLIYPSGVWGSKNYCWLTLIYTLWISRVSRKSTLSTLCTPHQCCIPP